MLKKRTLKINENIVYKSFLLLFVIWTFRNLLISSTDDQKTPFENSITSSILKILIWGIFGFFYINKFDKKLPIKNNQILTNPIKIENAYPIAIIFVFYGFLRMLILHKGYYLNPDFEPSEIINKVIVAAIFEEYVFRGWFLNALMSSMNFKKANMIASAMFVFIHYPLWIISKYPFSNILLLSLSVFVLGYIFGQVFIKSKSLWGSVILHMLWNMISITMM